MFCANASDGILTAHPALKGKLLTDIKDKKGFPLGLEIRGTASEGKSAKLPIWWPRPGSEEPLEKVTYFAKVEDQVCAVGYYK